MAIFVRDKDFYWRLGGMTLSIAMQNVIVFSVNLADNLMLGRYTEEALSGVALVNQIQFLLQMLVMGAAEGMMVFASRSWGEKDTNAIVRITSIGLKLAFLLSMLLWAAAFFLPAGLLSLLSNEQAVVAEGAKYLSIICFSYPIFAVSNLLLATLRSVETVKLGVFTSLSTLCINVFLNYILIYGNWGAPRLGVQGAAIATLTARLIELMIVLFYVFRIDKKLRLRCSQLIPTDKDLLRQYLRVGLPVLGSNGIWGIAMAVQTAILGHMGATAIAANSIATTVFQIISVVTYGSASASGVVIGKTIGEGKGEKVKAYAKTLQVLFLLIGFGTGAALFFAKDMVIAFYTVSPSAKEMALQFMTVLSITVIGTSYQMAVLTGVVRAGGDTSFVLKNDAVFMWGIVLPISTLAAFVWNLNPVIVFACLKSDQILKCFVAVVKVNRYGWIRRLGQAKEPSAN